MPDSETVADENYELMQTTAEMLAMPFLACRSRICRRGPRCRFKAAEHPEPWCLRRLDGSQRTLFNQIFAVALAMLDGRHTRKPAANPETLALEQAAMEIVESTFPSDCRRMIGYRVWKRDYLTAPASPPNAGLLAQQIRAELARSARYEP